MLMSMSNASSSLATTYTAQLHHCDEERLYSSRMELLVLRLVVLAVNWLLLNIADRPLRNPVHVVELIVP